MKRAALLAIAIAATTIGGTVHADIGDKEGGTLINDEWLDIYEADRICFARTDEDPNGPTRFVQVIDTFEIRWDINAGTTSQYILPCVPTACPDGWHLISGWVCSRTDPFAHLPVEHDEAPPVTSPSIRDVIVAPTIDVGPLVEPAIATVSS